MTLKFVITALIQRLLRYKAEAHAVSNSAYDTEHKKIGFIVAISK
jgi:hypothetical protein